MLQIIEQTREEKIAMYMKLTKRELAEMLINCNDMLSHRFETSSLEDWIAAELPQNSAYSSSCSDSHWRYIYGG